MSVTKAAYPAAMRRLIAELSRLPSIGERSATRLAYFLMTRDEKIANDLAAALVEARSSVQFCQDCYALTDRERCEICADQTRLRSSICVVEKPADLLAIERSGTYNGIYHVLHGAWSPLRGIGPERTKLPQLLHRLEKSRESQPVEELVLATSTTVEGDATALYIANSVAEMGIKVTRIAQGMPKGGELEYADDLTLSHAIEGRRRL